MPEMEPTPLFEHRECSWNATSEKLACREPAVQILGQYCFCEKHSIKDEAGRYVAPTQTQPEDRPWDPRDQNGGHTVTIILKTENGTFTWRDLSQAQVNKIITVHSNTATVPRLQFQVTHD